MNDDDDDDDDSNKFTDTRNDEERSGTSYIRWGRKTCEGNATLVYKGKQFAIL